MTDKEIRALIEKRRKDWRCGNSVEAKYKAEECDDILELIDSLQEEPVNENRREAILKKAHELAKKGELIKGELPKSTIVALAVDMAEWCDSHPIKEPVSEKKCLFTKDNYTDEDRNVLCEDCDERCEYSKKEEPVSDDLKEAANNALEGLLDKYDLVGTGSCLEMFKLGARWQKEQDQSTIELAEDHAMLAGMEKMKEQMMKNATEATVHIDAGNYPYIPQLELYDYDKDVHLAKEGDKYKVILIKKE